ncbi:MAG TPA: SDR family oxidoreductase [Verrucomicrobiae bacterium]|nr:SDR family oxidoreductase [Verrucomicrobiae bacterium]
MYIVTGGSDGLGKAIIGSLTAVGTKVINISRRENDSANLNLCCDLSTQIGIDAAVASILEIEESIEAVIFSAGVFSFGDVSTLTGAEYERVFGINTKSPMLMLGKLIDRIKADGADIVIVNSVAGLHSYPNQMFYNASKAALHSFTNDLRIELTETRSRVIGIYPGMLTTDLAQKLPHGPLPKSKHPTIDPEALADYITYTLRLPKVMEVTDIIVDRKKLP